MMKFMANACAAAMLSLFLTAIATPSAAMNRQELIAAMAADSGISKADATRALESFVVRPTAALKKGDRVAIIGFGSFSTSKRAARTGRNPQTGATIEIPARRVVKFKSAKTLSDVVNK